MAYADIAELGKIVNEEIVTVTTLGELRKAVGYERLTKGVLDLVSEYLAGEGLGYFPLKVIDENTEPRQWHEIRIYRRGTGVGRLIQAVTDPSQPGDRVLREGVGEGAAILNQIRALICE